MLLKTCALALGVLTACSVAASSRHKRIVGGYPALVPEAADSRPPPSSSPSPPRKSDNVVFVQDDYRTATVTGTEEQEGGGGYAYAAYKGIRYAEPPVGRFRFQRPVLLRLSGEIDATMYGPPCAQPNIDGSGIIGNEDCLFLNVFTPLNSKVNNTNLPVLIWIHGGGFFSGSAQQYGPAHLVKKGIIVVTVQYRLGSLGWLSSNLKELPGNVGFFDMRAAVKWVKEYISYFNGDPEKIVLSGQGSGASAATLLAMSDFGKGMISGVFAMSGTPLSAFAVDPVPKETYQNMTTLLGCGQLEALKTVKCLQMLSLQIIINSDSKFQNSKLFNEGYLSGLGSLLNSGPAVEGQDDGRFLPFFLQDSPLHILLKNHEPIIPMLTGVNKLETKIGILGKFKNQVLEKLNKIPEYVNKVLPHNVLNTNTGLFNDGNVNSALKTIFNNNEYLKLISSTLGNGAKEITKVVQGTTDALFNLPAFFTSHLWSKRSIAYFYSFEHKSNIKSPGKWFLPNILGVPNKDASKTEMVNSEDNGEPSHGDELIYLYDVRTIEGKSISGTELKDKKDIEMRDSFTSLVVEFVRNRKPSLKKLGDEWPSFTSSKQSDYVILDENARIEKKFRFCEMGLWGGIPDILQSSYCNLPGISDILKTVPDLLNHGVLNDVTEGTKNLFGNPINTIGGLFKNDNNKSNGLLGGVTGTLGSKPGNKKPNVVNNRPLLGGLIG